MSFEHQRILMKPFNESQFAYCPLEWMYYDKKSDNRKTTYTNAHLGRFPVTMYQHLKNLAAPIIHKVFEKGNIKYYPCS